MGRQVSVKSEEKVLEKTILGQSVYFVVTVAMLHQKKKRTI